MDCLPWPVLATQGSDMIPATVFVLVPTGIALCFALQARVTANGRVGATAAVYTAAILGK